jgi:Glycosyltransferase family 87
VIGDSTRSRVWAALLVGSVALVLTLLFVDRISRKMPDLAVYWTAATRARSAEPLYRIEDGHYQFKYLPAFAVLAIPLSAATLESAKAIWFVASVALLAALIVLSLRFLPERRKPTWLLIVITLMVMLKFYGHELVLGQMNALFAVIVASAVLALRRGNEWVAGALIALAIVVKPYAIIFVPWLWLRRQRGSIGAATAGTILALVIPAVVYGVQGDIELHRSWWETVSSSTAPNLTNADNVSIAAMWAKWIGAGGLATTLTAGTSALILALTLLACLNRSSVSFPEGLEAALLLTVIPLLSPQGWDYVFLVSTPAIMLLVNYDDLNPPFSRLVIRVALAAIGLSVYDIMGRTAYGRFMSLSIITVCYFIVVGGLWGLRHRRIA